MWSSAPKPDVAVTVNEKSPLQTSAARDERNPFSQQWSQNVKLLGDYCRNALTGDVIAGITVASVLVPQSMAYALLAGLPPEMGLYSSLLPLNDTHVGMVYERGPMGSRVGAGEYATIRWQVVPVGNVVP